MSEGEKSGSTFINTELEMLTELVALQKKQAEGLSLGLEALEQVQINVKKIKTNIAWITFLMIAGVILSFIIAILS